MSHFHGLLIVRTRSPDSVHKPQFLKREESRSGSSRGPSAYQPSALPLGHTGPHPARRKHGALRPQKLLRLIMDGEVGGSGLFFFLSNTYSLQCHRQNGCIKVGSCVSHFNVSSVVWATSQDSAHKPDFFKRKQSRS